MSPPTQFIDTGSDLNQPNHADGLSGPESKDALALPRATNTPSTTASRHAPIPATTNQTPFGKADYFRLARDPPAIERQAPKWSILPTTTARTRRCHRWHPRPPTREGGLVVRQSERSGLEPPPNSCISDSPCDPGRTHTRLVVRYP